jgi:hypothetical protein
MGVETHQSNAGPENSGVIYPSFYPERGVDAASEMLQQHEHRVSILPAMGPMKWQVHRCSDPINCVASGKETLWKNALQLTLLCSHPKRASSWRTFHTWDEQKYGAWDSGGRAQLAECF